MEHRNSISALQKSSDREVEGAQMEDEDQERERPEIAPAFYNTLGHQISCTRCTKTAVVRYMNVYFCPRCWEFLE